MRPSSPIKNRVNKPRRAPRRRVDGVLLLDKPLGMSSNAALQKVRWLFNAEKAGHTGTLDPLATGLLPLCLGEATKFSSELLDADKAYRATVRLGIVTATADAEGEVLETRAVTVGEADARSVLAKFLGEQLQVPPMYSALKRDGVPLYELARKGIEVERAPREVCIRDIRFLAWHGDRFDIDVECSKGTYIRTLAADIGAVLGCGAHLASLRRTCVGRLTLAGSLTVEQIEAMAVDARDSLLMTADALLEDLPVAGLNATEAQRIMHGQGVRWSGLAGVRWRLVAPQGFVGVGIVSRDGWLQPQRLIAAQSA